MGTRKSRSRVVSISLQLGEEDRPLKPEREGCLLRGSSEAARLRIRNKLWVPYLGHCCVSHMSRRAPRLSYSFLPQASRRAPSCSRLSQSRPHRRICSTSTGLSKKVQECPHPTRKLAPSTNKSIVSSLHSSSRANIASARTEAITRHLSTAASPSQTATMSYGNKPSEYTARRIGAANTLEYRCFVEKDGTPLSPFHDIPLYANEQQTILNMIVEIPRWSNAKLEV